MHLSLDIKGILYFSDSHYVLLQAVGSSKVVIWFLWCHHYIDKGTGSFALCHIWASLTTEASKTIAAAIVGSRLDFCNSFLAGTSVSNSTRLQLVQNTLALVVTQKPWFCRITPVLSDLHWFLVCHRISLKIATITFRVLQSQQPSYLASLIPKYQVTMRALHSSSSLSICVPPCKTTMAISKSFSSVCCFKHLHYMTLHLHIAWLSQTLNCLKSSITEAWQEFRTWGIDICLVAPPNFLLFKKFSFLLGN